MATRRKRRTRTERILEILAMMSTGEFYTLAAALEADHRGALFLFALERHRQGKGDPSALPFDPGRNDAELPEETGDAAADV